MITTCVVEDSEGGPVNYEALVKCPACNENLKVYYRSYKRKYKSGLESQGARKWYPASFERHMIDKHSNLDSNTADSSKKKKTSPRTMKHFFNVQSNLDNLSETLSAPSRLTTRTPTLRRARETAETVLISGKVSEPHSEQTEKSTVYRRA